MGLTKRSECHSITFASASLSDHTSARITIT